MSRSLLRQLADAIHPGPQRTAHGVQQVVQRGIVGQLASAASRHPNAAQLGEILLNRRCQLSSGCHHFPVSISLVYDLRRITGANTPAGPANLGHPSLKHPRPLSGS